MIEYSYVLASAGAVILLLLYLIGSIVLAIWSMWRNL